MTNTTSDRLVVPYDAATTSVFAVSEAADDLCDIVWLVDFAEPGMDQAARLMRRIGTVVDITGMTVGEMVTAVGETGPSGVMAVNDRRLALLAEMAAGLGLEFHSPEVAARLGDKQIQRRALREAGLTVPPVWEVPPLSDRDAVESWAEDITFPAMLKPRSGDGSRGVVQIRDVGQLVDFISGQGESAGWMVEGYLGGNGRAVSRFADVVSVESFVHDGSVHHLAVTGRFPFADPFRETGSILPSDIGPDDAEAVMREAAAALTGLGVRHGCHHTELKFTPDGPCIIEVNGRIGGGIPKLLALAGAELNLTRLAMQLALGKPVHVVLPLPLPRIAYRRIAAPPTSAYRVAAMSGHDDLKSLPGVDEVTLNRLPGDPVDWRLGFGQYVFSVFGTADSYDQVRQGCELIDRTVRIDYDEAV